MVVNDGPNGVENVNGIHEGFSHRNLIKEVIKSLKKHRT